MGILNKAIAVTFVALLAMGCASTPADKPSSFARKASGISQAGWIYARSVYENPVNRPVSHFASLGSLSIKSTAGLLRRVSLSTIEMPALDGPIPAVGNAETMDLVAFENTLDKVTGTRQDVGRIKFLVDGDEYFGRLMESIESAQESIDIRTYIFDNDDFAVAMADELRQRAEDVRVRVMVDSIGNMLATQADSESLPETHNHPLSINRYLERGSNVKVRSMTNPWFTGDHTKTTIIDKKTAFLGGMNIGREYRYDWHDLMMEVTGPAVDQLQFESDKAWSRGGLLGDFANAIRFLRGKQEHADRGGYPVRILQTRNFQFTDLHSADRGYSKREKVHLHSERVLFR